MEYLYHEMLPKVKHYVMNNSGNADDAFDVFQDAMVAFCKYVKQGKFNTSHSVHGFLFSVAKNVWINKVRKNKKMVFTTGAELFENGPDPKDVLSYMITEEREKQVRALLSKLGEKCQKLLKLAIYEELSGKEICERLGIATENGVKTQKYKCKKQLLEIIKAQQSTLLDSE